LYDELGVEPSADQERLHRAYRRRARQLHPDLHASEQSGTDMQRLNEIWAVLGDPESRRRYDQQLTGPPRPARPSDPLPDAAPPPPTPDEPRARTGHLGSFGLLRPSVIILAVLFLIFIVTAYAGHSPAAGPGIAPTVTASSSVTAVNHTVASGGAAVTAPPPALVGRCIQDQGPAVLIVPCSQRPNSLIVATMPASARCPTGTVGYLLTGQTQMVCAAPDQP
jgi:hypothetical protein